MTGPATVFVVEDDRRMSAALVQTLESEAMIVRACADGEEFLRIYSDDGPGCLVTDVRMPGMSGLDLQQHLSRQAMYIPIVFITGHGDVAMSVQALKRGAVDFLQKPFSSETLVRSVREALSVDARRRRIERERFTVCARYAALSEREARVMTMVIEDWSNKEIARALCISPRTVEHHREHVMKKMEARSLSDLLLMGLICGVRELSLQALHRPMAADARPDG